MAKPLDVTTVGGVDPTGASDSASAINSAWTSSNPLLYFPSGKYRLDSALTPPNVAGVGIIGDHSWTGGSSTAYKDGSGYNTGNGTLLIGNFGNGTVIATPSGQLNAVFKGFTLTRSSQASSGYGLDIASTSDRCWLEDLHLMYHAVGLHLGSCGKGWARQIVTEFNSAHGMQFQGQWDLLDIFSTMNGGTGFVVSSDNGAPASSGQWRSLATFGNTNYGMAILGQANGTRIEAFRLNDCFFGGDGMDELYIDSYSTSPCIITNSYFEAPGGGFANVRITGNNSGGIYFANSVSDTGPTVLNGQKTTGTY